MYSAFPNTGSLEHHSTQSGGFYSKAATDKRNSSISQTASSEIKVQEMITLVPFKNSGQSGNTKKMLHAPTLKLFVNKEIPLNTKEAKSNVKSYIEDWVRQCSTQPTLLNVLSTVWNSPEGYLTVITEHCSKGSLKDLLSKVESLPESAILPIALDLLRVVSSFQSKFHTPFRSLSIRQILFTNRNDLKISFGFSRRIRYLNMRTKQHKDKDAMSVDCFEIGLILLRCVFGELLDVFLNLTVLSGLISVPSLPKRTLHDGQR